MVDEASILAVLSQTPVPETPLTAADIATIRQDEVVLTLGYPVSRVKHVIEREIGEALSKGGCPISVRVEEHIPAVQANSHMQSIPGVKNIIAVASGKGGGWQVHNLR